MPCSTRIHRLKGRFVLVAKSNSETKRVRYLLGLSSPIEREHIESEYFADEDAFQAMLTAEDDLIDAYARGELADEERWGFEKNFVSSFGGRDRVRFAHAFAGAVSPTRPVETKLSGSLLDIFKTFQLPGLLRIATISAVIVLLALLAWLVMDRRSMSNELRELRAQSAEFNRRTKALQRSSDTERIRTAEIAAQLADLRAHPDKSRHRERGTATAQRAKHLPEVKNSKSEQAEIVINTQAAPLGKTFERIEITELPVMGRGFENLLTVQPATTRDGYVAGARADQANTTLDSVDVEPLNTQALIPRNTSRGGNTTVRGTVKEPNGNVVRGAIVTLTDPARNFTRTQFTNKDGAYVFNAITPGTYSLEVQAPGFKTASASGLAALVDTPTVLDVQLEVGAVSETVAVTSAAETAINTSDATLGNSFEPIRITELPLDANNVVGMRSLQPDVSRTGSVNGGRADQSSITLDGIDATIRIPGFLTWIRFQLVLETAALHEDYRVNIETADGRPVRSVDWSEPLTPNQTIIDTPAISTGDLSPGDYVLLLLGKEPDGSFVKVAEFAFKIIE